MDMNDPKKPNIKFIIGRNREMFTNVIKLFLFHKNFRITQKQIYKFIGDLVDFNFFNAGTTHDDDAYFKRFSIRQKNARLQTLTCLSVRMSLKMYIFCFYNFFLWLEKLLG